MTTPLRIMVGAEDAAAALSIGVRTFHRLVARGTIPPGRRASDNTVRWLVSELQDAAARLPMAQRTPKDNEQEQTA